MDYRAIPEGPRERTAPDRGSRYMVVRTSNPALQLPSWLGLRLPLLDHEFRIGNRVLYHTKEIPRTPLPRETGFAPLKPSSGTSHRMRTRRPRQHRSGSAAQPRAALWRGVGCVPAHNLTTVFPWFPNLEKPISGVRKCTKVHGGVLGSPGSPPLGRPLRALPDRRNSKEVKFWCSFGAVSIRRVGLAAWPFRARAQRG
jgi:hypothetical protein